MFRQTNNFNDFYLVDALLSRNFCQKKRESKTRTLWKLQKFSVTLFSQKFRESSGLLSKEITKLSS